MGMLPVRLLRILLPSLLQNLRSDLQTKVNSLKSITFLVMIDIQA